MTPMQLSQEAAGRVLAVFPHCVDIAKILKFFWVLCRTDEIGLSFRDSYSNT